MKVLQSFEGILKHQIDNSGVRQWGKNGLFEMSAAQCTS